MAFELADVTARRWSAAMPAVLDRRLAGLLHPGPAKEDLAFAYWRPSRGERRTTAIIGDVVWPREGDRVWSAWGGVAFTGAYTDRVLAGLPAGSGVAFMHGHVGPGWQDMSDDDVVAERDRLAGPVAARAGIPLLGMTRGTDGTWSARVWGRAAARTYRRVDVASVRVVGEHLAISFHPDHVSPRTELGETATVWGHRAQADLGSVRIGVVGLGSVGSLAAEALSRIGVSRQTYVDHDVLEDRNLDRVVNATAFDVGRGKVDVAADATRRSHTAEQLDLRVVPASVLEQEGYEAILDCDLVLACVDRPLPRWLINTVSYAHLIPAVDAGISTRVRADGRPLHVAWRITPAGPGRACMLCAGALRRSDVALDLAGLLDDPDYVAGLGEAERQALGRRNVFAFSMSAAAHQVLQAVGIISGLAVIGGTGVQLYNGYPGEMTATIAVTQEGCEVEAGIAQANDCRVGLH